LQGQLLALRQGQQNHCCLSAQVQLAQVEQQQLLGQGCD
jgi:hypothetical protein